ncbi:MAG: restriction endonuclease subunit S [Methanobrevibacter sp.]|jgi:type I restriction enzyme S subunit|nr:restriction endonuclease subunit S [Candidatus Methanovirga meridionalis]
MFGNPVENEKNWDFGYLKDIIKLDTKSIKPANFDENDFYIGLEHIESNSGKILKKNKIKDENIKSNKYSFNENHVLYGKLRPYLNKVALPSFNGVCSTDIIPILPITNFSNKLFIKYLLSLDYYIDLATEQSTGANLPRISPKKLERFKIPKPPIEIQNKFAEIVKKVEKIKEYQNQSKIEINNLFNNLMQKSFKN